MQGRNPSFVDINSFGLHIHGLATFKTRPIVFVLYFRTFPWYWYTLDHVFGSENIKMRIIMFETTIPCGFGARPDGIPLDDAMAEEQWIWLEEQLILGQE